MLFAEETTPSSGQPTPEPVSSDARIAILVVDDAAIDRRLTGRIIEKDPKFKAIYANDGQSALEMIEREKPVSVITDMQMPLMDGLQLVEQIRRRFPSVPVIVMTGNGSEKVAMEALKRGAASYFPKPQLVRELRPTLHQVLSAANSDGRQQVLSSMTHFECKFNLKNDPTLIPPLVGYLQEHLSRFSICDQTQRTRVGIALEEALLNGLYHGNLEVSSDLKQQASGEFELMGQARRGMGPYRERHLHMHAKLETEQAVFVIRDEGLGYDVSKIADPTDPVNLEKVSGRGLLLIPNIHGQDQPTMPAAMKSP